MTKALRVALSGLLLLAPYACGGESRSRSDTGSGAVGGTTGGTGFTGGTGGKGGSAGTAAAGAGADGGSTTTGGSGGRGGASAGHAGTITAGAAGSPNDRCAVPAPMLFSCDAGASWFYHDGMTGECVGVGPDQCGGGAGTSYSSLADCLADCPGAKPSVTACDHGWECTVVEPGCCGGCDPVTSEQLAVANVQRAADVVGCDGGVACGACADVPEAERTRQYFIAPCSGGNCRLMDLRHTSDTACSTESECFLREGTGCCPGCRGQGYISVSSTEFLDYTCSAPTTCPACLPPPPTEIEPYCEMSTRRCSIRSAAGGAAGAAGSP